MNERSALLKLTSGAMVKASSDFIHTCKHDGKRWTRIMENERELRQKFEDMVEQYAQQHSNLEAQMRQEYHLKDPSATDTSANHMSSTASEAAVAGTAAKASQATDGGTDVPEGVADGKTAATSSASPSGKPGNAAAAAAVAADAMSGSDDDDDFHDAVDDEDEIFTISAPPCYSSPDLR